MTTFESVLAALARAGADFFCVEGLIRQKASSLREKDQFDVQVLNRVLREGSA